MRRLLYILLTAVALTLVMGCSRSVDKRLVLADTLMWTAPDSSLKILTAINRDSLQDKENLAYHALLLTQAQFRCNGNCESDTLINLALSHYSDNHIREHYTRSLMYKGAFNEVHDNPVEAIKWYKCAEDNADSTDYRNLAQINMRMGMLYYNNYNGHIMGVERFYKSNNIYKKLSNEKNQATALHYLGNIYRLTDSIKAIECLESSYLLAKGNVDSIEFFDIVGDLALAYLTVGDTKNAKKYINECLTEGQDFVDDYVISTAARIFIAESKADSALFFIKKLNWSDNPELKLKYYITLGDYYKLRGDLNRSREYYLLSQTLSDSLEKLNNEKGLITLESDINKTFIEKNKKGFLSESKIARLLFIILLITIVISVLHIFFRRLKYKKISASINDEFNRLNLEIKEANLKQLEHQFVINETLEKLEKSSIRINKLIKEKQDLIRISENTSKEQDYDAGEYKLKSMHLSSLMAYHINVMRNLMHSKNVDNEMKFAKTVGKTIEKYKKDDRLFDELGHYIDVEYDNYISDIKSKYNISKSDLQLIILKMCDFDNVDICFILGFSTKTIYTKMSKLARKLNIETSLSKHLKNIVDNKKGTR